MFNSISWQTKCFQSSGPRRLASTTSNTKARHHCQPDLLWGLQRTLTFTHIFLHFFLSLSLSCIPALPFLLMFLPSLLLHPFFQSTPISNFSLPQSFFFPSTFFSPFITLYIFLFSPRPALSLSSSFDGLVVGGTDSARLELLSQCEMCCCGDDMSHFTQDWWCVWEGARERALEYREWGSGEFTKCYRSMRTIGYR